MHLYTRKDKQKVQIKNASMKYAIRTCNLPDSSSVLVALTVAILNDRYALPHPLDELHNLPQASHMRLLAHPLIARPTMDSERVDARIHDALNERKCVLLRGQEADLRREADLARESRAEGTEDRAEAVGVREECCAHAGVCGEGLGAAAVEVDAGDVGQDGGCCLDGECGVGGAELEDEEGPFEGVCGEDGFGLSFVGDDACDS